MSDLSDKFECECLNGDLKLKLKGDINFDSIMALKRRGEKEIQSVNQLVVDLSRLDSAHSSILSLLLRWLEKAKTANIEMKIEGSPKKLFDVARVSGLDTVLPFAVQ